jgi:hypothetical protein
MGRYQRNGMSFPLASLDRFLIHRLAEVLIWNDHFLLI